MSIAKAQADSLASGFLDNVGSNADRPFVPKNIYSEAIRLAADMVQDMQDNLNASNSNASGKLSESIELTQPEVNGTVFSVGVELLHYGEYLNSGVRGTKSGSGKYAFKTDMPSRKMIESIKAYIKFARLSTANTDTSKTIYKRERKQGSISQINSAFAMARSIKQHGIKPTGFIDKAVKSTEDRIQERLGNALRVDIIQSLKNGLT